MNVLELIDEVTELAKIRASNTELSLYRWMIGDGVWRCEVGNPSMSICIGETSGEFRGEGETLEAALRDLISNLQLDKKLH